MTSFQLTPQAVDDLLEIWSYIGEENPASASRVEESILAPAGLSQNRLSSERSYPLLAERILSAKPACSALPVLSQSREEELAGRMTCGAKEAENAVLKFDRRSFDGLLVTGIGDNP
jgi:hypothetical protein